MIVKTEVSRNSSSSTKQTERTKGGTKTKTTKGGPTVVLGEGEDRKRKVEGRVRNGRWTLRGNVIFTSVQQEDEFVKSKGHKSPISRFTNRTERSSSDPNHSKPLESLSGPETFFDGPFVLISVTFH